MGTLVHHDGALGDVLLSLPALRMLRDRCGPLHLVTRQDVAGLLGELGWVEKTFDAESALFSSFFQDQADAAVKGFLDGYDGVTLFTARQESLLAAAMKRVRPDTDIVMTIPPTGRVTHVADFRLRQVALSPGTGNTTLGSSPAGASMSPLLHIPESARERARDSLAAAGWDRERSVAVVHPGSGGRRKCWPLENYVKLAETLRERFCAFVVLLSGPAEEDYARALKDYAASRPGDAVHVGNQPLSAVAALVGCGSVYIGNDSGVSHLAGLAGTRTFVLFGPTDPVRWRPLGERVTVMTGACDCAPCDDERSRSCRQRRCLSSITVRQVARQVGALLRAERGVREEGKPGKEAR